MPRIVETKLVCSAGKLDKLAEDAIDEYKAGKTRPFPE